MGPFFLVLFDEMLINALVPQNLPCPGRKSNCMPAIVSGDTFFQQVSYYSALYIKFSKLYVNGHKKAYLTLTLMFMFQIY